MFNRMINQQDDDSYVVLPSDGRSEWLYDNRPQHFKVDLPKEIFLEGAWEVGATELLYTHTFSKPATFALTTGDRTWSISNDARLDGGTHFITIAEEQYPGYYDVFKHVFEAMVASVSDQNATPVTLSTHTGVCGSYHRGGPTQVGELQSERW